MDFLKSRDEPGFNRPQTRGPTTVLLASYSVFLLFEATLLAGWGCGGLVVLVSVCHRGKRLCGEPQLGVSAPRPGARDLHTSRDLEG